VNKTLVSGMVSKSIWNRTQVQVLINVSRKLRAEWKTGQCTGCDQEGHSCWPYVSQWLLIYHQF